MRDRLRIIVKDDRDSAVGRGGYLLPEHFAPHLSKLVEATARSVESILPSARILRITEGWRPQRNPSRRDAHAELAAFDFTVEFAGGQRATFDEYRRVAERTRQTVGDAAYDFLVHGDGSNLHIHAEHDPR